MVPSKSECKIMCPDSGRDIITQADESVKCVSIAGGVQL